MDGCWVCGKVDGKITDIVIKLLEEFLTQLVRLLSFRRYGRSQRFFVYERTCCVKGHLVDRAIMTSAVEEKINCEREPTNFRDTYAVLCIKEVIK